MSQTATTTATITNRLGLHARPAMMFVEKASTFESSIKVQRVGGGDNAECVDGKSIMQMMMLAATQGTELKITAEGADAQDAVAQLKELVDSHFGEE